MGREARRNADALLLFNVERKLAGLPICTCPRSWFLHHHDRAQQRMTESERHLSDCGMHVKEPRRQG
jgi:hypothetical protein